MRQTRRRRPRALRLDLRGVDFDADGPGDAVDDGEDVDGDDDNPAAGAEGAVHGVACVKAADQEHGGGHRDAAVDGAGAAAPFVGEEERGNGDGEDDDGRDAGGEEG